MPRSLLWCGSSRDYDRIVKMKRMVSFPPLKPCYLSETQFCWKKRPEIFASTFKKSDEKILVHKTKKFLYLHDLRVKTSSATSANSEGSLSSHSRLSLMLTYVTSFLFFAIVTEHGKIEEKFRIKLGGVSAKFLSSKYFFGNKTVKLCFQFLK